MKKQLHKSSAAAQQASLVVSPAKTGEEYSHILFWLDAVSRCMSDVIQDGSDSNVHILDCPFYYIYSFCDQHPAYREHLVSALRRGAIVTRPFFGFQSQADDPELIIRSLLLSRRYGAAFTACINEQVYASDVTRNILNEFQITRLYIFPESMDSRAGTVEINLYTDQGKEPQSVTASLVNMPVYSCKSKNVYSRSSSHAAVMNMVHMIEPLSAITKTAIGKQAVENLPLIWKHMCQPEPGFPFTPAVLNDAAEQGLIQAGLCCENTGRDRATMFNTMQHDLSRVSRCFCSGTGISEAAEMSAETDTACTSQSVHDAVVCADTLPALGYISVHTDTVSLPGQELTPVTCGRFFMENEYLAITAEPGGAFSLHDKIHDAVFSNMGGIELLKKDLETGSWRKVKFVYSAPRISLAEDSSERTVLRIRHRCRIRRGRRLHGVDTVKVWVTCILERASDTVRFVYDMADETHQYVIAAKFVSGCSKTRTTEYITNNGLRTLTHRTGGSFSACCTDCVAVRQENTSFAIACDRPFMHMLVLDNQRTLLCTALLPGQNTATGKISTTFMVRTGKEQTENQIPGILHAMRQLLYMPPCLLGCFQAAVQRFSLVSITGRTLFLGACKPAENGEGYILRLFNYLPGTQKETLKFGHRVKELHACFCDERKQHSIDVTESRADIEVTGHSMYTLLVVPEE